MKWEIYKKLTPEQREEWKFKYDQDYPSFNSHIYLVLIYALVSMYSAISLVLLKEYVTLQTEVIVLFSLMMKITLVLLSIWAIEFIIKTVRYFWIDFKGMKWLKKIGDDKE